MILITGAAGFIGANLVRAFNEAGRTDLILVDRMGMDEKWKNLKGTTYHQFLHADQIFDETFEYILDDVEMIFHLGACSSTTEKDMDYLMFNNVQYSQSLYLFATEKKIPFIYASSAATYGDGEKGYDDNPDTINELLPLNPYGYSKQVFDQWVMQKQVINEVPPVWFGLKFFNVYGPREDHKDDMRSIAHKAYGQILENGLVKLFKSHRDGYKDGFQLRDFIYVKDCTKAMIELSKLKEGSAILNMGTGKARSFYDLVAQCFKSLNKEINIEYIDMPLSIRNQYQYFTEAKMDRFHSLVPNFKFHSLEEGVNDYIQYLKSY